MTADKYKEERKKRGNLFLGAALLHVNRVTIARRETGTLPILKEAELALLYLPVKKG